MGDPPPTPISRRELAHLLDLASPTCVCNDLRSGPSLRQIGQNIRRIPSRQIRVMLIVAEIFKRKHAMLFAGIAVSTSDWRRRIQGLVRLNAFGGKISRRSRKARLGRLEKPISARTMIAGPPNLGFRTKGENLGRDLRKQPASPPRT